MFVVEPTVSGVHDFRRVAQLAARLDVPGLLAVNKADLNEEIAEELEAMAAKHGIRPGGPDSLRPRSDPAQIARKTVVEASDGPAARGIRQVWSVVEEQLRDVAASVYRNVRESMTPEKDKEKP